MPIDQRTRPQPTSHSFISQRLRLHYADWGNADAPPIVLVHGGRDHSRSWDWIAERLADRWHVIAPDLRGHGDSGWSTGCTYMLASHIYDLAQLIHQQKLAPVTLVGHSLGGQIVLRYAGLYPDNVRQIVAVEGLGQSYTSERGSMATAERTRRWIQATREVAAHAPLKYPSLDAAEARMREANAHLSVEQARHLTIHGINQNEDGTYSWKFDPYVRTWAPYDMPRADIEACWSAIDCPALLICGTESWHTDPSKDGRAALFKNARVRIFDGAGHWVHHDRLEGFMEELEAFLKI
jgi:pimeloyl-ACP methyl ester carboxylesterase